MPAHARSIRFALLPIAATALAATSFVVAPAQAADTAVVSTSVQPQQTMTATYRAPRPNARVLRALSIMKAQTGDPYRYGAAGPNAFDCSGLVYFATRAAGFKGVPRTSGAQAGFMRHIPRRAMQPGDFVFFTGGGRVYHVGVYVGRHRILHAPYSGTRVRTDPIWSGSWFAATLRRRG
jgi:cell wall-associated NlpC family hydrolase